MIRVKPGHCMENKPIKAYEPCQIRKEAAISRYFYVRIVFHREIDNHTIYKR